MGDLGSPLSTAYPRTPPRKEKEGNGYDSSAEERSTGN